MFDKDNKTIAPPIMEPNQVDYSSKMKILELSPDMYCFNFTQLIKDDNEEDEIYQLGIMSKTIFSFLVQGILTCLLLLEMGGNLKNDIKSGIDLSKVNTESVYKQLGSGLRLYMARIVCVILLHIMCLKEVKISLEMMNYAKNNWKRFGDTPTAGIPPFMIAIIKLKSSLLTEVLNLIIVLSSDSVIDVVKDFVALLVVLYISFIMTQSITGTNVPVVIAGLVIEYPVYQN